ncbi:AT-rich interactive domain-containing protein 2-like [Solanum lycopersicum]|uniref:ELM2 domain-containing protein n=1 Tax=Solanum lycopersicum TaxID=4081 RepID=A0A3Q7HXF6_SOLLC|nr:AT-rich interactive domain-containing protein 2-like [Solanum lycopersicum]XP_025887540.1 AT-rich interactive domain-containing protein 2-like [Solanum lycopersicum]
MTKAKELADSALTSEKKKEWCEFIYEDRGKLVIPVGPRFQVDVPDWANSPNKGSPVVAADVALRASTPSKKEMVRKYKKEESDTSKWLGTLVWPRADNLENKEDNEELVGKGRNEHCSCRSSGSIGCVKRHVKEESMKLKSELETAFNDWKFDEMGEEVSKLWNTKDQTKFSSLVKTGLSKGKSFMKPALASFPSKNRQSIVNYYFNVHIPRRIRSNSITINTDDEEEEDEEEEVIAPKHSHKRNRAKKGACSCSKSLKRRYLSGRR